MSNTIIACIDGSAIARSVCEAAAWVSQRLDAPLRLLHVLEKVQSHNDNLSGNIGLGAREELLKQLTELDAQRSRLALEHGRMMLDDAARLANEHGAVQLETKQRHGGFVDTVLEQESETRVLVLGRQGEDHASLNHTLGSHLETLIRSVHKPILVTVGKFSAPQSFMVAFDGSETAQRALNAYAQSPLLKGLPCHLVMAGHQDKAHSKKLQYAADVLRSRGFEVCVMHLPAESKEDVQAALKTYQRDHNIGLMVMGTYGHSRIRQFFVGSHTRTMVSQSDIPLLLLR